MKLHHFILGFVGLLAAYVAYVNIADRLQYYRYRLTVEIEADGKEHSASSVIEVRYWWTTFSSGTPGWAARVDAGLAPMVDLGRYGTVIAAMEESSDRDLSRRVDHLRRGRNRLGGRGFAGLAEEAFKAKRPAIASMRGIATLEDGFPTFIWVPPSNDWRDAKQLWKDEFEQIIGVGVRLRRIVVELRPDGKPMVIPTPRPGFFASLCSPEVRKRGMAPHPAGALEYLSSYNVGAKFEYYPFAHKSICDYL